MANPYRGKTCFLAAASVVVSLAGHITMSREWMNVLLLDSTTVPGLEKLRVRTQKISNLSGKMIQ